MMGCGEHPEKTYSISVPYTKTHQPSSPLPALPHPPGSHLPQLRSSSISSLGAGHPHSGWTGEPHGVQHCLPDPRSRRCRVRIILQLLDRSRQHVPERPTAEHASGSRGVPKTRAPHQEPEHPSKGEKEPGGGGHRAWVLMGWVEPAASPHDGNLWGEAPPEGLGAPPWGLACTASLLACHGEGLPSILPLGIPPQSHEIPTTLPPRQPELPRGVLHGVGHPSLC